MCADCFVQITRALGPEQRGLISETTETSYRWCCSLSAA